MTKLIHLEVNNCAQCPYRQEDRHKGLPNGVFRCHKTWEDHPSFFQSNWRVIPTAWELGVKQPDFPDWCPLPNVEQSDRPDSEAMQQLETLVGDIGQICKEMSLNSAKSQELFNQLKVKQ